MEQKNLATNPDMIGRIVLSRSTRNLQETSYAPSAGLIAYKTTGCTYFFC